MAVRQIERARAQAHALHAPDERSEEYRAGGDVLGQVGCVLADIALDEAQFVGEQESLAILA